MRRHTKSVFLALCVVLLVTYMCFIMFYGDRVKDFWSRGLNRRNVLRAEMETVTKNQTCPIPSQDVLAKMSPAELQLFYHSYVNSPQVICTKVVRMGLITDGGWEFCDDPIYKPNTEDCLVYSFGINRDFSYDDDMAKYGCEIHAFDPSMQTPSHQRSERVYFHAYGVGGENRSVTTRKGDTWPLFTIASFRKMYHHTPSERRLDVVKMDVERAELESLTKALDDGSLDDVRQLSFETHLNFRTMDPKPEEYIEFLTLLRKIYEKGFRIYLTHRNFVYSAFQSLINPSKHFAKCHEIHTININIKNNETKTDTKLNADARSARETLKKQRKQEQGVILQQEAQLTIPKVAKPNFNGIQV